MPQISGDTLEGPLLYSERPDWADVTPIPQYEGYNPIAPIFYAPECELALFLVWSNGRVGTSQCGHIVGAQTMEIKPRMKPNGNDCADLYFGIL